MFIFVHSHTFIGEMFFVSCHSNPFKNIILRIRVCHQIWTQLWRYIYINGACWVSNGTHTIKLIATDFWYWLAAFSAWQILMALLSLRSFVTKNLLVTLPITILSWIRLSWQSLQNLHIKQALADLSGNYRRILWTSAYVDQIFYAWLPHWLCRVHAASAL